MLGPQLPKIEVNEEAAELEIPVEPEPKPQPQTPEPSMGKLGVLELDAPDSQPESTNEYTDGFPTVTPRSSGGRWIWLAVLVLFIILVGAGALFAYIELRPSPAKAYAKAWEQLTDISSLNFDFTLSFDLKIEAEDTSNLDTVVVFSGVGKYDKPGRKILVEGEDQSLGNKLAYKQTILGETVYIKYNDRNYLATQNLDTAVLTIQDLEAVNMFSTFTPQTRYGYGSEEMLGMNNTYRFRVYPADQPVKDYVERLLSKVLRTLYPVATVELDADTITFGEVGYRVWVDTVTYLPRKLQLRIPTVSAEAEDKQLNLTDLEVNLVLLEINPTVSINAPI